MDISRCVTQIGFLKIKLQVCRKPKVLIPSTDSNVVDNIISVVGTSHYYTSCIHVQSVYNKL